MIGCINVSARTKSASRMSRSGRSATSRPQDSTVCEPDEFYWRFERSRSRDGSPRSRDDGYSSYESEEERCMQIQESIEREAQRIRNEAELNQTTITWLLEQRLEARRLIPAARHNLVEAKRDLETARQKQKDAQEAVRVALKNAKEANQEVNDREWGVKKFVVQKERIEENEKAIQREINRRQNLKSRTPLTMSSTEAIRPW